MGTEWKSQQCFGEGKYYLQVETDDKDKFKFMEKMAQTAMDGHSDRIIISPCKAGDKVYKISRNQVKECEVVFIGLSADDRCSYFNFVENYADGTFYKSYSMVFDVIGKSVFLTREEAEAKLKGE